MTPDDQAAIETFAEQIADRVLPDTTPPFTTHLSPGRCQICQCSELRPCQGGCVWTDERRDLCSTCALHLVEQDLALPVEWDWARARPELELRLRAGRFGFQVLSLQHGQCVESLEELLVHVRTLMAEREAREGRIWTPGDAL